MLQQLPLKTKADAESVCVICKATPRNDSGYEPGEHMRAVAYQKSPAYAHQVFGQRRSLPQTLVAAANSVRQAPTRVPVFGEQGMGF
jgi:hypothetical protein